MNRKIFVISVVTLVIDQICKSIVQALFRLGESITFIPAFLKLTYIHNEGAAWGIFANRPVVIIAGTIVALFVLYRYMYSFRKTSVNEFTFGLLVGGITGNLIDRVLFGYVRDFIDIYIFGYDFPVFNFADMAIVVGVILLIIAILKGEDRRENSSERRKSKN